jgi:hypothetical protein
MEEIRRCSRCILPETFPKIHFDEKMVCNFCLSHQHVPVKGEENLAKILQTQKGETYDCVVPISGGKDSTFILYYAVRILKLRVIAVNYDSGFQTDLARENIINVCKTLNVPLTIIKANINTQRAMLREALLISKIAGNFFKTCGNCSLIFRTISLNTAKKYMVPFILSAESSFVKTPRVGIGGIKQLVKNVSKRNMLRLAFHGIKYYFFSVLQMSQMKVPLKQRFNPFSTMPISKGKIQGISIFHFLECDTMNKVDFLTKELGWKFPENQPDRFDCLLHCFSNFRWFKEIGITMDGCDHSTMIRENLLSRDAAMLSEKMLQGKLSSECFSIVKAVGLEKYSMPGV